MPPLCAHIQYIDRGRTSNAKNGKYRLHCLLCAQVTFKLIETAIWLLMRLPDSLYQKIEIRWINNLPNQCISESSDLVRTYARSTLKFEKIFLKY